MRNLLKFIFSSFFLLYISVSYATKIKPVTLQQLTKQADIIALVEIQSSRLLKTLEYSCGIEHQANTYKILKGNVSSPIKFGYMNGLKTGKRYLVFLSKDASTIFTSSRFQKQFFNKPRLNACKKIQQAKYTLSQAGTAYFEIEPSEYFNFSPSVRIQNRYFSVTDNIKGVADTNSPNGYWVKLDDIIQFIKDSDE